MGIPHISYTGACAISGTGLTEIQIPCREMSINIESKPTFYDHTVGLFESYVLSGGKRIQKKYYRYTPVTPKASISGFLTSEILNDLMDCARWGGTKPLTSSPGAMVANNTLELKMLLWQNGIQQTLSGAYLQTLTLDIRAGEPVSYNAEFVGKSISQLVTTNISTISRQAQLGRLITWDACKVWLENWEFSNGVGAQMSLPDFNDVSAFSITINNPVTPIFTANTENMFPADLRIGMQDTTGSITIYGTNNYLQGKATLRLSITLQDYQLSQYRFYVAFEPPSDKASASAIFLSTSNFTCWSDSGVPWEPFGRA
jgi:hypothetical protein